MRLGKQAKYEYARFMANLKGTSWVREFITEWPTKEPLTRRYVRWLVKEYRGAVYNYSRAEKTFRLYDYMKGTKNAITK